MECPNCHNQLIEDAGYCPSCGARQLDAPSYNAHDYAAFISYRHRSPDADIAKRLHRAIETYRLPKDVARSFGSNRIGRIFRDQDELSVTGSLPSTIREALERSNALIVVCSPETQDSAWVKQEIELFASFHGRDRIFAALAEGNSAESLPDALRLRTVVSENSDVNLVEAQPLAADMRQQARKRFKQEKLRIIAALTGCSYDELVQRDVTRRVRTAAAGSAAAVCIVVAIALLAANVIVQHNATLEEESQRLAAESQQQLAGGDRYGAIETALRALPDPGAGNSRPLVDEAQQALEDALEIGKHSSPWLAGYSIEAEHDIFALDARNSMRVYPEGDYAETNDIAINKAGNYFAVSDVANEANIYDLTTGKHLATCDLSNSQGKTAKAHNHMLEAGKTRLVANDVFSGIISCFEIPSGKRTWSYDRSAFVTMALSPNEQAITGVAYFEGGGFAIGAIKVSTDKGAVLYRNENAALPEPYHGAMFSYGSDATDIFFAIGNKIVYVDLLTSKMKAADLAYEDLCSLSYSNGTVIACTTSPYKKNEERDYRIEAFNEDLSKLWSAKGKVAAQSVRDENENMVSIAKGYPKVCGYALNNKAAVVSAGRYVRMFDPETGEELYQHGFSNTVIDVLPWMFASDSNTDMLCITTSDGNIMMENPTDQSSNMRQRRYARHLDHQIRWSRTVMRDNVFTWLSMPANDNKGIVAFRTDLTSGKEPEREYTLDELVRMAHKTLEER